MSVLQYFENLHVCKCNSVHQIHQTLGPTGLNFVRSYFHHFVLDRLSGVGSASNYY